MNMIEFKDIITFGLSAFGLGILILFIRCRSVHTKLLVTFAGIIASIGWTYVAISGGSSFSPYAAVIWFFVSIAVFRSHPSS